MTDLYDHPKKGTAKPSAFVLLMQRRSYAFSSMIFWIEKEKNVTSCDKKPTPQTNFLTFHRITADQSPAPIEDQIADHIRLELNSCAILIFRPPVVTKLQAPNIVSHSKIQPSRYQRVMSSLGPDGQPRSGNWDLLRCSGWEDRRRSRLCVIGTPRFWCV